jgi:tight adherence protein B
MTPAVLGLTVVFALSAALLAWFAIDFSVNGFARYREAFTKSAKFHLSDMFLFIDPGMLFIANVGIVLLGGFVAWIVSGTAIVTVPVMCALVFLPRWLYARMRRRRLKKFEQQLPDALMMLAGGLRAGVSLSSAIQQLVIESEPPLSQEFTLMLREQRLGVTLEESLAHLARRVPTQTVTLVVSAMRIANETGGGLAETLERTSSTVRSTFQIEGKIDALTAQGKLQAWVVGALPLMLMAVLNKMEPEAMSMLWHTPIGWATLLVIGFLEAMGIWLIRKIIAIDV